MIALLQALEPRPDLTAQGVTFVLENARYLPYILAAMAIAVPFERFFGAATRPTWSERLGNVLACLVYFFVGYALLFLLVAFPGYLSFDPGPRSELLNDPWVFAFVAAFVLDGFYYLYHRLQHAVPLLWRIHKFHHTDPAINMTTSHRTHVLEAPIQVLVVFSATAFTLGFHVEGFQCFGFISMFFLYFSHLDLRLTFGRFAGLAVGPQYHRIHHAYLRPEGDSNFAQFFPFWDWVGRTYHHPQPDEFPETGVEGCESARGRWLPMLW